MGGGALAWLQPGLREGRLTESGRMVFSGLAPALLDGSLPLAHAAMKTALEALLVRIDALVAALPPHAQSELSQLLALLASSGGRRALAALHTPWSSATAVQVQESLQAMRVATIAPGVSVRPRCV